MFCSIAWGPNWNLISKCKILVLWNGNFMVTSLCSPFLSDVSHVWFLQRTLDAESSCQSYRFPLGRTASAWYRAWLLQWGGRPGCIKPWPSSHRLEPGVSSGHRASGCWIHLWLGISSLQLSFKWLLMLMAKAGGGIYWRFFFLSQGLQNHVQGWLMESRSWLGE